MDGIALGRLENQIAQPFAKGHRFRVAVLVREPTLLRARLGRGVGLGLVAIATSGHPGTLACQPAPGDVGLPEDHRCRESTPVVAAGSRPRTTVLLSSTDEIASAPCFLGTRIFGSPLQQQSGPHSRAGALDRVPAKELRIIE